MASFTAALKQWVIDTYAPIPTGTPDGTKYLRDDNTWAAVPSGGGGDVTLTDNGDGTFTLSSDMSLTVPGDGTWTLTL